jgi:RNA polymerase sigma factor (sigma-70 family)
MASVVPEVPVLATDEAFEKLYKLYVKDVYHYALALLRNPADAEDVTQTTFMNAYRAYRRGEEIRKPQNWLIKIAHNVARTRYSRMTRRVKEVPLEEHVEQLSLPEEDRPDVEAILRALGRLPFNQRAALVMRELEGRTYAEISDTLGVSVAAVETLIFRARRSLRVRAAALKSIAAVPLPTSLTQLFEGGGAVAGSVGTGFLVKAAVALVAGAFATGLGGDRNNGAVASDPRPVVAASRTDAAVTRSGPVLTRVKTKAATRVARPHRVALVARPTARWDPPAATVVAAATPGASTPSQANAAPAAASTPSASAPAVVQETVESTLGTVQQTVAAVTAAVPVTPPSVPIQAPNLPKLP